MSMPTEAPKNLAIHALMADAPCENLQQQAARHSRTLRVRATVAIPGTSAPFEELHSRTATPCITAGTASSSFTPLPSSHSRKSGCRQSARPRGLLSVRKTRPRPRVSAGLSESFPSMGFCFPFKVRQHPPGASVDAEATTDLPGRLARLASRNRRGAPATLVAGTSTTPTRTSLIDVHSALDPALSLASEPSKLDRRHEGASVRREPG